MVKTILFFFLSSLMAFAFGAQKQTMGEKNSDVDRKIDEKVSGTASEIKTKIDRIDRSVATREFSGQLTAWLVDPEQKAQKGEATVQVRVQGLKIVDPATRNEQPREGEGHLHYRIDSGPVIATTATKLSFHELSPGEHQVSVVVAANDHRELGQAQQMKVVVPVSERTKSQP